VKVVTSGWWVQADQVSKTAPSGEYLTTGSFMIRGKKNFLPPSPLVMGFGFFFKLDDESISNHAEDRRTLGALGADEGSTDGVTVEGSTGGVTVEGSTDGVTVEDEDEADLGSESGSESGSGSGSGSEPAEFPDVQLLGHSVIPGPGGPGGEELQLIETGWAPRIKQGPKKKSQPKPPAAPKPAPAPKSAAAGPKRGQKFKERKMKEKYGDQDEEERALRLQLLQAPQKETKKRQKAEKQAQQRQAKSDAEQRRVDQKSKPEPGPKIRQNLADLAAADLADADPNLADADPDLAEADQDLADADPDLADLDLADDDQIADDLTAILSSLTGKPLADDVLHYAVPVCAPYPVISGYKYKVKLIPGTGKKGKATKQALTIFLKDKDATQVEKDLLKAVQDSDLSRNLPGKVKIAVAQSQMGGKAKK